MIRRRITVLGATGSVGCSTLDLMDQAETAGTGEFEVEALTGGANVARLAEQARRWKPKLAVTADPGRLNELREALAGTGIEVAAGDQAVIEAAARPADWIMAAIVGAAGLRSAWSRSETAASAVRTQSARSAPRNPKLAGPKATSWATVGMNN